MLVLDSAIQAALDAGVLVMRGMVLFEFASGSYGFWDGAGPLDWNGQTFNASGSLISVSPLQRTTKLASSARTIKLRAIADSALTPDVLGQIELEDYKNRPVTEYLVFFDPDTRVMLGQPLVVAESEVDYIEHDQSDGEYVLVAHLETRSRDYRRKGPRVRGHKDQVNLFPGDTCLQNAEIAAVTKEYFAGGTPEAAKRTK